MPKERILLVEDEALTAEDLKKSLNKFGYDIVGVVTSGMEALEQIPNMDPDLILMDIMLEGDMDGIETAAKIKEDFDVPIIYLTAYTDPETRTRAQITEPFGYLTKPFKNTELEAMVEITIQRHKKEKELQEKYNNLVKRSKRLHGNMKGKNQLSKKQSEIIQTALNIIATRGIQNLTLQNIADEMSVSEPALYRHFNSKGDIFVGITITVEQIFSEMFSKISKSKDTTMNRLKALYLEWFNVFTEYPSLVPIIFSEDILKGKIELTKNIQEISRTNHNIIMTLILESQKKGIITKKIDPAHIALILIGSIGSLAHKWNNAEIKFDLHREGKELWTSLLHIILTEGIAPSDVD